MTYFFFFVFLLQSVLITSSGAWKLGGFGFAISTDQSSNDSANSQAFHYAVSNGLWLFVTWVYPCILLFALWESKLWACVLAHWHMAHGPRIYVSCGDSYEQIKLRTNCYESMRQRDTSYIIKREFLIVQIS